mmetsp:Transcript_6709/g.17159  ORF Transcript_6709/g.17159 Transcript_6709/m.17159 type:complete len:520 (+) Transcript_6709:73-1632(+)
MAARSTSIVIGSVAVAQRLGLGSIIASAPCASRVVGVFTSDVRERAQPSGATVHELTEMPRVVRAFNVTTALITDATDAQAHAQLAIDAGCTRIVNLTSAPLHGLPADVEHEMPLAARLLQHMSHPMLPNAVSLSAGRLEREYELVGPPIGRGGFGVVLRARNRLDGLEYAVKRVEFRSRRDGERALREAQAMAAIARACPSHIVQYYCSWVEAADAPHAHRAAFAARGAPSSEWSGSTSSARASSRAPASVSGCGSSSAAWLEHQDCAEASGERVVLHLVMELMTCNTLRAELLGAQRAWTDTEVCSIIEQLALALAHVHAAGYVHRDVAPANCFLERAADAQPPRMKLGDFGLAQRREVAAAPSSECCALGGMGVGVLAAAAEAGGVMAGPPAEAGAKNARPLVEALGVGTFLYAAPEQAAGATTAEPSADVFSLGVLLAELLHGPFGTLHVRTLEWGGSRPYRPWCGKVVWGRHGRALDINRHRLRRSGATPRPRIDHSLRPLCIACGGRIHERRS